MLSLDFSSILHGQYLDWLIAGAFKTLRLFGSAWVFGFVLSLLLVAMRSCGIRLLQALVVAFVGYHRNVPSLVQLFVWYFGMPQLLPESTQAWINAGDSEWLFALIALSLNAAAYMSEDLRSGVRSLPSTQMEAARALGLSFVQAMQKIILPQALRVAVPPLINQSVSLFKATSLAMAIGVAEMTYISRQIESQSYRTFEVFALASVFYWLVSFLIMGVGFLYNAHLRKQGGR